VSGRGWRARARAFWSLFRREPAGESRVRALWARVRGVPTAAEMEEEVRFHLERSAERNLARGMAPAAARRDARLRFGGVDRTLEAARDDRRGRWLEDVGQDARHAVRQLARSRGFAFAAICTLALGIGANTAIFSVLDAVLLQPLPYGAPDELVTFEPGGYRSYLALTEGRRTLVSSGAYTYSLANVTSGAEPVRVFTLAVTSSLLPALGRAPLLGRNFTAEDERPGAPPRVLLRHAFWQSQFAADPSVVGGTIELNGAAHEVIGILPADLAFPPPARRGDGSMPRVAEVWTGVGQLADLYDNGGFAAIARLAPGATAAAASAELTAAAAANRAAGSADVRVTVRSVTETVVAPLRPAVIAFAAGVALVLLIACANLGSLLLARLAGRRRELAVRVSLGAGTGRLVRQILTEGAVLAAAGALVGLAVAWLVLRTLIVLAPPELARVQDATLNARVLGFTLALSMVTALLIGLLPAWRAVRRDPRGGFGSSRGTTGDRSSTRVQTTLVACEVAFAFVLLVGGGLLLRSFASLSTVSPGFPVDGLVTADLLLPDDRYEDRAAVLRFYDALEDRLAALPGVRTVSAIDRLPYGSSWSYGPFQIVGRPAPQAGAEPRGANTAARPGYFQAMGIPILQGRGFTAADATTAPKVVVIGRALAERYWPGESPIGQRILLFGAEREIVGIAGDVRQRGPSMPVEPLIYVPQAQDIVTRRSMTVVVRSDGDGVPLARLRDEIRNLDATLPITNLQSFDALRANRTASERFDALLIASFAILAALLAAVGIYGVMSFVVAQRTREIGVRMALGASGATVTAGFLRHAMRAVGAGALAGIVVALPLSRLLRSMLFGIAVTDVVTYVGVAVVLAALAAIAAFLPARRASAVPPGVALAGE
jgi:putative ABC transport system permease protein